MTAQRSYRLFFFSLLLPLHAFAADAPKPATPIATSPVNMILGFLFLLALVGAGWWLVKRAGGLQFNQGSGLKMIATLAVGPRERVVLIELGGEQWLLGVAPGRVNLLHRFEQPIAISGGEDFAGKIRQVMQQGFGK